MKNIQKSLQTAFLKDYYIGRWYNYKLNWGDAINPILIEGLFHKKIYHQNDIVNFSNKPVISAVGSILNVFPKNKIVHVWGSGVANPKKPMGYLPEKIYSVRGPKTLKYLKEQNIQAPDVFGDPVLLIDRLYNPDKITKKFKLGIIKHYEDKTPALDKIVSVNEDIIYIPIVRNMDYPFEIIDEIQSCEKIISSSLHGLILADVYKIPNAWVFFDGFEKSQFKFLDYYESINVKNKTPQIIKTLNKNSLMSLYFDFQNIELNTELLLQTHPFKK